MNIYEFMEHNPWLTFFLIWLICEAINDITKIWRKK